VVPLLKPGLLPRMRPHRRAHARRYESVSGPNEQYVQLSATFAVLVAQQLAWLTALHR